ncbi:MAG TPA: energy transducer TonB, partial [Thermoanaerobaculia bacterium]|nr:energy transducer TonB [Thermoanaerobaculia bacterium]
GGPGGTTGGTIGGGGGGGMYCTSLMTIECNVRSGQNLEEMTRVKPSEHRLEEQIDLVVVTEEKKKTGGLSIAVVVSLILHSAMIVWFLTRPRDLSSPAQNTPMLRYVQLLKDNPKDFVEAPGQAVDKAPLTAPLSDQNRKASMPEPTGEKPTTRPGDGRGLFKPQTDPAPRGAQPQQQVQQQQPQQEAAAATAPSAVPPTASNTARAEAASNETFTYREPTQTAKASAAAASIDWRSAIKSVKGPLGGGDGIDLGGAGGGELGTAEQGPLSFETQWYDWGDYAQSMISRIRVNWYGNMPQLIRSGIGGVVTIRFTIQRDGRITDTTIVKSSGHPPYDFAARKAIELSSPLNALPKDFPNPYERVTAMFYYNMEVR